MRTIDTRRRMVRRRHFDHHQPGQTDPRERKLASTEDDCSILTLG
jgi:hypothetical protein